MKAAVYLGKENIEIKELPMPECGDNDVIIENLYSSICGTDVAVFHHGPGTDTVWTSAASSATKRCPVLRRSGKT